MADATHLVVSRAAWLEEASSGVSALHCKLYGKTIISEMCIANPVVCRHFKKFSDQKERKYQRQTTYTLFVSEACKDKHHNAYAELQKFAEQGSDATRIYNIVVKDGGASDILQALKACRSAVELKSLRWLVSKAEVKDCTVALATAIVKAPKLMTAHVRTMSQFIDELGCVLNPQSQ